MGYQATVDTLTLEELKRRAEAFAASYDPGRPTVILVPGGMGSRLIKSLVAYEAGVPFPDRPVFQKIWLSLAAVLMGDLVGLRMTRGEHDRGDRPVIAFGEVSTQLAKKYDNTRDFFSGAGARLPANYEVFGYDWRKLPRVGATYLRQFLRFVADEAAKLGKPDPRPGTTLLGHSQGGLVVKLFLNDLVDRGDDPDDWLARFISVGTPFYGTETHLSRYYVGVTLANLFTPGGRRTVTDLVWSLPGPYVLLPAPRSVLEPRFDALGLNRYPMVDRDNRLLGVDPFASAQRARLPGYMTAPADHLRFTATRLARAAQELAEVDRELPGLAPRIFHIRSTLRTSGGPLSRRIHWENVDGASYDIDHGRDPISDNGGDTDGTVPLWSAALAWTPGDQILRFQGLKHAGLAEHEAVLEAVADIVRGDTPSPPPISEDPPLASEDEAIALATEAAEGRIDVEELATAPEAVQRRLRELLEMT